MAPFFKQPEFYAIVGGVVGFWGGVFGMGVIFLMLSAVRRRRKLKLLDLDRRGSETAGAGEELLQDDGGGGGTGIQSAPTPPPKKKRTQRTVTKKEDKEEKVVEQLPLGEVEKGRLPPIKKKDGGGSSSCEK